MIEEVANALKREKIQNAGILATSKTVESRLYQKYMEKQGIKYTVPSTYEQRMLSEAIVRAIRNNSKSDDKEIIKDIAHKMSVKGAKAIIFACTDIGLIINKKDLDIRILDSIEIITEKIIELMRH